MRANEIIRKKRDSQAVSKEELEFLINGNLSGDIPDYQVSSFLMAVYLNGMSDAETVALTDVMLNSGSRLNLSSIREAKVDKHSTGGVGDKPSIILAPLLASMGIRVPMIAGRGLGHTGGTIDKLESIPGFRTSLTLEEFRANIEGIGCTIMGQSDEIAPADKKLYSLRDVTATVESIPLIASSIMSKKLAEGADGILLDVKVGDGAFMKDKDTALKLARTMVAIGTSFGVKTVAVLTDMNQPIGRTIGNALEIKECISALRGKGSEDLMELVYMLGAWMTNLADSISEETTIRPISEQTMKRYKHEQMDFIEKGDAFKKFVEMVDAQGGDAEALFNLSLIPHAENIKEITADEEGYIKRLSAYNAGSASVMLGAGREKAGDRIDFSAGIVLNKNSGDYVKKGDVIALLHYNDDSRIKDAEEMFRSGIVMGDRDIAPKPLVLGVVLP